MTKPDLLTLLSDGQFHSGQELADSLAISRTAVWKQVKKLQESGLNIESSKGSGYRIAGGLDLLRQEDVVSGLNAEAASLLGRLSILDTVDSTNSEALRQLESGKFNSDAAWVFTAEQQTAGRGRRGRQWVSPYASSLYVSLVWEFPRGAAALEGLSLAVGVAVVEALQAFGTLPVQLKWPNDILIAGAKLGGILLEVTGDAAGPCQVVVGIGLNVALQGDSTETVAIDQDWTDLSRIMQTLPGRSDLLSAMLNQLLPLLATYEERGFAAYRERWQCLDAFKDQAVVLSSGDKRQVGIARGLDERGGLLLETDSGLQSIYGGEVSLRPHSK